MTPPTFVTLAASIKNDVEAQRHITVTELARSNDWRKNLPAMGVIEILDHGVNAGWLISDDGIHALIQTIEDLEERLERIQIEGILEARRDHNEWLSGEALVHAADAELNSMLETMND